MKKSILIGSVLFSILLMAVSACSKEDTNTPQENTNSPSDQNQNNQEEIVMNPSEDTGQNNTTDNVVTGGCKLSYDEHSVYYGGQPKVIKYPVFTLYGYVNNIVPTEMGFVLSEHKDFSHPRHISVTAFDIGTNSRRFSTEIEDFELDKNYYYYAYVKIGNIEYPANSIFGFSLASSEIPEDDEEEISEEISNTAKLDPGANKAVEGQYVADNGYMVNVNSTNTITVAIPKHYYQVKAFTRMEPEVEYEYVVGSYTKQFDTYIVIVGGYVWGTVAITPVEGGKYTVTIDPEDAEPIVAEAVKAQPVASGETTDNLCRTWKPYEVRIEVLRPGATSWIGKKAIPDFKDVKLKVEEEGCNVDDDFGNGYELERISFDNAGGFTIAFNLAKNPDAKPYVGAWSWRDQAAGTLQYTWAEKYMGNSFETGDAQVEFKTVYNTPECWLNLHSTVESDRGQGTYQVKLKICMHELK